MNIKDRIYEIRGSKIMLDRDLACLIGYETKVLNQLVRRNINKFETSEYFQINLEEFNVLKSQIETANTKTRSLPYVFTEQGVAMLASVLRANVADEISVKIMDAFVKMRRYISNSLIEQKYINELVLKDNRRIELLEETFNQLEVKKEHLFFEGQIYDAYSLLIKILSVAKEEIIIIDNYAGRELFDILKDVKCNIKVITKNTSEELIKKYNKQYNNVDVIKNDVFRDRFIIIDRKILYHSGASFKDLGNKCFAINKIQDKDFLELLLNKIKL